MQTNYMGVGYCIIPYKHSNTFFVVCNINMLFGFQNFMQISFVSQQPRQNDLLGIDDGQLEDAVQWQVKVKVGATHRKRDKGSPFGFPIFGVS